MDSKLAEFLEVGDTVFMTKEQAKDNYGEQYINKPLTISHIATNKNQHRGFCPESGNYLYDFDELEFSLYEWEITTNL